MAHVERIKDQWNLNNKSSVLNSLQVNKSYGLVNSLMAPMSAGGKVIIMSKFDPLKTWSLILGVGYNGSKDKFPRDSVDTVALNPAQYERLIQKYEDFSKVSIFRISGRSLLV